MNLRLPDELQAELKERAEAEGRSMHAVAVRAIERYLADGADRETVRKLGAKYASAQADLLRRLGE
ncbi:Arc family DNA-binding protein [Streptomyces sp. DSM 42041]|uniref:Arc family DNA-binding protein n=2 Tax=Streptomyces hazeniae TaxID=3075538 RepID=A0ABU2NLN5_9ACTN|nr:Arc family DNA-binding protein [Streptomyces sp. DSM 42041]MDT0377889.1 Arc family DNA-binding protein [Streptomyces sp. DSM 42041]